MGSIKQIEMNIFKLVLIFIILTGALNKNYSQEDWQFVPNNYTYIEGRIYLAAHSDPGSQYIYEYLVDGDTTIERNRYQLVKGRNIGYSDSGTEGFEYSVTDYIKVGGLRKDSAKVYFRSFGTLPSSYYFSEPVNDYFSENEDQIIFDFSLESGDTVLWKPGNYNIVDEIDTVTLENGEETRRFIFVNEPLWYYADDYWVEGIGSARGLLGTMAPYPGNQYGPHYQLYCVGNSPNGQAVFQRFQNSASYCNLLIVTDLEEKIADEKILIYPNPSNNRITIKLAGSNNQIDSIELCDITGKSVYREVLDLPKDEYSPDVKLNPGCYIVVIKLKNGKTIAEKILVLI